VVELQAERPDLIEISTADVTEVARVALFSIDGTEYTIPETVPASMSLRVLDTARRQGMEVALSLALEELLGPDGYRALLTCDALTSEHMGAIMDAVQALTMGELESTSGN
jgi:hypothetical protein